MSTKKIKLMADYQCYPLWDIEKVGNIDPNKLPISAVLKKHLNIWAECYDEILVIEEPRLSGFQNEMEALAFEAQGQFLWRLLQKELGDTYEVFYFSHLTSQLLEKNEIEELIVYPKTKAPRKSVYVEAASVGSMPLSQVG
jgi:hypothetical protein